MAEKFRLYITDHVRRETLVDIEHKDFLGFGVKGKGQTGLYLFAAALVADCGCDPSRERGAKYESFVMDKSVPEYQLALIFCSYLGLQDSLSDSVDMMKEENWRKVINDWMDPLADKGFRKIAAYMQKPIELVSADLLIEMDKMYQDVVADNPNLDMPPYKQFSSSWGQAL